MKRTLEGIALPIALAVGLLSPGCSGVEAEERVELTEDLLPPSAGLDGEGGWQSVDWDADPWHRFSGGATLVLHHGLGRTPTDVSVYLGFDDRPLGESGGGAALAAGDMARVRRLSETTVEIRNRTEADFFCRVILH